MKKNTNKLLLFAILLGLAFHGSAIFFTLETTYDALIHVFFAEHYASNWFEPWNYKWYTGFTVMSYPPLVHQAIAALSLIGGLKFGLFIVAIISVLLFITGVYRYCLLLTGNKKIANYSAILAVFSSCFIESLHVFGQLPSIIGISVLMHSLPEIYLWLKKGTLKNLATSLSLIAVTVTSHHVTPIFGMVFFIFPLIGMVIIDFCLEKVGTYNRITFVVFFKMFKQQFKRNIIFGVLSLCIIFACLLPYWINTKNNPITQVPIPHGSRDNFLEITSSGLIFFMIPWGVLLFFLPYFFYRFFSKRYLFFGISFTLLFILGSGGTTPIPKLILGENAFSILTLDRFTFWAIILALPLFAEFIFRFIQGDLKELIQHKYGALLHRLIVGFFASIFLFSIVFTMSLGYFRPSQPQKIRMLSIVNFLNQDNHDQWRYLTLGFGDQMAWLSAQTSALTVDGNYHSARRLPELTTRPIERLENSKFKGVAGMGSLQQFLTTPEKYNLKFIFSNDKFYAPILYFCGWEQLTRLENGILVWQKLNVPPLASVLPKDDVDQWQKLLWGLVPFCTLLIAFLLNIQGFLIKSLQLKTISIPSYLNFGTKYLFFPYKLMQFLLIWCIFISSLLGFGMYLFYIKNNAQRSPTNVAVAYYDAIDLNKFEKVFQFLDPNSGLTFSQYILQISVTDGLLSSYAKLDAIHTNVITQTDSLVTLKVETKWITPLEKITKLDFKTVVKRKSKWYLKPTKIDPDIPPDQLYTANTTEYFNQGRRRITSEQTYHEDILKQPNIEILSAKLIQYNAHYALVGEIQNIDNVPADVVLKGTLYNDKNIELATYNAKYHVKHKLMPKEKTSFRINFEGIAWSKIKDSIPKTFNPDEFTPLKLEDQPIKFNLQVEGNVTTTDLYKDIVLSDISTNNKTIKGTLFNSGIKEITIPQVLISYYSSKKELVWVDHLFIKEGIKQQKKQYFSYNIPAITNIKIIDRNMANCFVNGLPNAQIASLTIPNRIINHTNEDLQKIEHPEFSFIKIEMNAYIGNKK